jgi:(p)ppGpp synthase/HD superfamily hydrolase
MTTAPAPTMTVADAHAFFKAAHAGQVDKQDRDYYEFHLVPIAKEVEHLGDVAVIAALGHDYIEDIHKGDIAAGVAALRAVACPEKAITAIVSVTRMPGETYYELITRSCADELGCEIKLADNGHNIGSSTGLAATDPKKAHSLLTKRYLPARDRLIEARTLHRLGLYPAA